MKQHWIAALAVLLAWGLSACQPPGEDETSPAPFAAVVDEPSTGTFRPLSEYPDLFSMDGVTYEEIRDTMERLVEAGVIPQEFLANLEKDPEKAMETIREMMADPSTFGIDMEAERRFQQSIEQYIVLEGMSPEAAIEAAKANEAEMAR